MKNLNQLFEAVLKEASEDEVRNLFIDKFQKSHNCEVHI